MGIIERRSQIDVSVIKNMGDLTQAMAIRSAVFIGEYGCSHDEEFDGNDFSATHIIAKVGGQPAGTMRLRYFADFVIPERTWPCCRHSARAAMATGALPMRSPPSVSNCRA